MNDEEINKLLKLTILSENTSEINDDFADNLLSNTEECSPAKVNRVRKKLIEKILNEKHPIPIKTIEDKLTFGVWLENTRTSANLTLFDIANALQKEQSLLDNLEKSRTQPWHHSPTVIAEIMNLFQLHFEGVKQLILTSNAVNQAQGLGTVSARSRSGKMDSSRGDSTSRALELFLANNVTPTEPIDELSNWIESLREVLKQSEYDYLLK